MNFDQYNQIRHKIKGPIFSVITPFKKNGDVDYIVLKNTYFISTIEVPECSI